MAGVYPTIATVLVALTVPVLLSTVAEACGAYVPERTAESVVLAARRSLIGRLLRLRLPAVDRMQPGDLTSAAEAGSPVGDAIRRAASAYSRIPAAVPGAGREGHPPRERVTGRTRPAWWRR
ncbi:hypothetical protein GCM10017750_62640 [Streptomyces racemochromogenes]